MVNNPSGEYALWFWTNVLTEAFALTGAKFADPNNTWVFYIDSDPGCEQAAGATLGVVLLGANDLRGLAGEPYVPPRQALRQTLRGCAGGLVGSGTSWVMRFGLPHPPECEDSDPNTVCPLNTLMYLGYITYPQTFLLETDKETLAQSGFFSPVRLRQSLPECSGERRR